MTNMNSDILIKYSVSSATYVSPNINIFANFILYLHPGFETIWSNFGTCYKIPVVLFEIMDFPCLKQANKAISFTSSLRPLFIRRACCSENPEFEFVALTMCFSVSSQGKRMHFLSSTIWKVLSLILISIGWKTHCAVGRSQIVGMWII